MTRDSRTYSCCRLLQRTGAAAAPEIEEEGEDTTWTR